MQDLNDMALFAKVVEHGGFSAAATALGLQKSFVSRRIGKLEESLGLRLVERTTRHFRLTEIGELYTPHCNRLLEEAASAEITVAQMQDHPQGVLKVSASVAVGQMLISPLLPTFLQENPDVDIDLELTNRRVEIIDEACDLVIRVGKLQDSTLVARKIWHAELHLYASPGYVKAKGAPSNPEELVHYDCIQMGDLVNPGRWEFNSGGDLSIVKIKPRVMLNDFVAIKRIAMNGFGIAILPNYIGAVEERAGTLVRVLPEWHLPSPDIYALYTNRTGLTKKVKAFLDYLIQTCNL
ncbi:LysR family transcriptional regulator [Pseudomaricurvus alkylphenolicus]|uniref:LysR family transcriptional regulator n=1 Tax=Pseudomaricurvus alkylphenolicus TaxID=1306991 RepID=UPI00142475A5|nr:LysR family transcriptional regulator [Pseudomaricurvus alkylphenolicus]NIB40817.1 LysR family transcriptional regulator [Pseudomaricurvus alkylphenolicus]